MTHSVLKVEERGVSVELKSCADDGNIRTPLPLERKDKWEVSFVNPRSLVRYPFSFKSAELQGNIWGVFHHHV